MSRRGLSERAISYDPSCNNIQLEPGMQSAVTKEMSRFLSVLTLTLQKKHFAIELKKISTSIK